MSMKKVFEQTLEVSSTTINEEDGGMALIVSDEHEQTSDDHLFVRVQSWDDDCNHPLLTSLKGKRIRVTIEEIVSPIPGDVK